jgi:hypothetical protein
VSIEVLSPGERARALEHDVHVQRLPRQTRGILFTPQRQPMLANSEGAVIVCFDRLLISSVDRVVLQEIHDIVGGTKIVHGDQVQARCVQHDLECGPTDSSQSVDGDLGHGVYVSPLIARPAKYWLRTSCSREADQRERRSRNVPASAGGSSKVRPA